MKMHSGLIACFFCALWLFVTPSQAGMGWLSDVPEACRQAKAQHKDLMVVYKGSNWEKTEDRDIKNMLSCEAVMKPWTDQFVLLELSHPQAGQDDDATTLLILADENNRPYYALNTSSLKQGAYWISEEIGFSKLVREKVASLFSKLPGLQGNDRFRLMGEILQIVNDNGNAVDVSQPYIDWVKELKEKDKQDVSGYKKYTRQQGEIFNQWAQFLVQSNSIRMDCDEQGLDEKTKDEKMKALWTSIVSDPQLSPQLRLLVYCLVGIKSELGDIFSSKTEQDMMPVSEKIVRRIEEISPGSRGAYLLGKKIPSFLLAYAIFTEMEEMLKAGKYDEILQKLEEGEKKLPCDNSIQSNYMLVRGKILIMKGEMDDGLAAIEKAAELMAFSERGRQIEGYLFKFRENRELILELLKEKQQGNSSREQQLKELLFIMLNMEFMIPL